MVCCGAASHKNSFCNCGHHTDSHGPEITVASDYSVSELVSGMEYSTDYTDKMPIRVHPIGMLSGDWQQFRYAIMLCRALLSLILLVGLPVARYCGEPVICSLISRGSFLCICGERDVP